MTRRVRREVALGLGCYAAMLAVRAIVLRRGGATRARNNARRIMAAERRVGLDVEPALQGFCLPYRRALSVANVSYVVANIVITFGWLARLLRDGHPAYAPARRAVAGGTLAAQLAFLAFPAAPPRSADHAVDTIAELSGVDLDGPMLSRLYNPLAAMPSIHMTYAVCTASSLRRVSRRPAVRCAAVAYPPLVGAIVVATGNHYLADVAAGAALGAVAVTAAEQFHESG